MTWAFLDDHANENDKLEEIGGAAAWYWACGLMYCRRKEAKRKSRGERLDFIADKAALALFADPKAKAHVKEIVRVGLWLVVPGGYRVNDYREVYGADGSGGPTAPLVASAGPAASQPTASQLGGKARAGSASRGPAGRFQPGQPRARQDPDPDPEKLDQKAAAKDLKDSAREAAENQAAAAAGCLEIGAGERARLVLQSRALAPQWLPQRWPELVSFAAGVGTTWQPISLGPLGRDPLVELLLSELAADRSPAVLAAGGCKLGEWLAKEGPGRITRTLNMVTFRVLRQALDEAQEAARFDAAVEERIQIGMASGAQAGQA